MTVSSFARVVASLSLCACNAGNRGLVINEIMSSNTGAFQDAWGEDNDYIEVVNTADHPIAVRGYVLTDRSGKRARLPERTLSPGEVLLLVADGTPEQGPEHLPFRLSASGDEIVLGHAHGFAVERVAIPALESNETLQRFPDGRGELVRCKHASPGLPNGDRCRPRAREAGPRTD